MGTNANTPMNKKQWIGIVFSAVWLIVVFLFVFQLADLHDEFHLLGFIAFFTLFGIFPLAVGWGIWWIFRHGKPPGTASK
jgi:hypothetical protein